MKVISNYMWIKVGRLFLPLLTITLLLVASCSHKQIITPNGKTSDGEALVTLSLKVPAATRSLAETEEEAVKIVHVLAFKDGKYKYSASSTNTTDNKTFQITLRKGTWDLVVLANASSAIAGLTAEMSQTDLLNSLTKTINVAEGWKISDLKTTGIPMSSSVLTNKVIDGNTAIGTTGEGNGIALYRMVAKADIAIAPTAQAKFKLASVRVYNYNSKGRIHPNATDIQTINLPLETAKIKGNTDADKLSYAATSETACTREIYLNESSNPIDLGGMSLDDRTCLIVGGRYDTDSDPTYYRVDFSRVNGNKDDYLDIIRNHHYTFNITKVDTRGYGDENTAFESRSSNMTVEVTLWNQEEINDIITDGQYGLGVNRKTFTFSRNAMGDQGLGGANELVALTSYTGSWTVAVKNSDNATDASASSDASWLKVRAHSGGSTAYALTATGDTQQSFFIMATENTSGADRTAYVHVKVKKLGQVIKVTQTTQVNTDILLTLKSGNDEVTELVWDSQNATVEQSLTAIWSPSGKQCVISKTNSTSEFKYALPAGGLGSATITGGAQTYGIKPHAITTDDPDYPFVDRSSVETFTISNGETSVSKSVTLRQKNYALLTTGFTNSVLAGVEKTVTIRCNTDWTVTATYGTGLVAGDVAFTTSGVANTTDGSSNFSYKVAEGKYGKVTFTFSPKTADLFAPVTVSVTSKQPAPPSFPAYPGVIGYDPDTETLNLDGKGVMVYFKYGSVVAIYAGYNGDKWKTDGSLIAYNPTDILITDFASIPYGKPNSNVFAEGVGDPCKLVGYKTSELTHASPNGWILPTHMQNSGFNAPESTWTKVAATAAGDATPRLGRIFYVVKDKPFLPAVGFRQNTTGEVKSQGSWGYYWYKTQFNDNNGYNMSFRNDVANPTDNTTKSFGMTVRCIREE